MSKTVFSMPEDDEPAFRLAEGLFLHIYLVERLVDGLQELYEVRKRDRNWPDKNLPYPSLNGIMQLAGEQIQHLYNATGNLPIVGDQIFVTNNNLGHYAMLRIIRRTLCAMPNVAVEEYMALTYDLDFTNTDENRVGLSTSRK